VRKERKSLLPSRMAKDFVPQWRTKNYQLLAIAGAGIGMVVSAPKVIINNHWDSRQTPGT
jgi:hypothetical protein